MRIMSLPKLPPGYWFENVAPLGDPPEWRATIAPTGGNPNGDGKLFGYSQHAFLARQYK